MLGNGGCYITTPMVDFTRPTNVFCYNVEVFKCEHYRFTSVCD